MRATRHHQEGFALLGAMMLLLILAVLGGMLLNLAGQDAVTAAAGVELALGQHLADAAGELAVAALNSPHAAPAPLAVIMNKRHTNALGAPSFFDAAVDRNLWVRPIILIWCSMQTISPVTGF